MVIKDERFFKTIKSFLDVYLIKQRNYSENTQESYRESISLLLRYFKEIQGIGVAQMSFDHLTYENICAFLNWLENDRKNSCSTINLRLMAIRAFAKYAGIFDPAKVSLYIQLSTVPLKKGEVKIVDFLKEKEIKVLFAQPNTIKKTGLRDQFFMILMYDLAARCQEMLNIQLCDLDLRRANSSVYLNGKGAKCRRVPLSDKVVDHLKNYLGVYHPEKELHQCHDYLFYTVIHNQVHQMSADTVAAFISKYGSQAKENLNTFPERVHPHQLRHSRAMHLYRGGMPLVLLAEFLGHASVNTTQIYAYADIDMKRSAIEKIPQIHYNQSIPVWKNDEEMIKKLYGLN